VSTHYGLLQGKGFTPGRFVTRYPLAERSLVRVLANQARERSNQDWIIFDGRQHLTFGDAWRQTCRTGHALDAGGLANGDHVGLMLRNQSEFLPAFYGAMVRGGVAVPLNADSRGPLLQAVIERSEIRVLVARADLLDRLAELDGLGGVELIVATGDERLPRTVLGVPVIGWSDWLAGKPESHDWPFPTYSQTCLLQYTSGTTANQKGAIYPHHFLYLFAAMIAESLERDADQIWTTPMPLYHVAALHIITNTALHAGATSHLKSRFSASKFWQQVADDGACFGIILGPMAAMVMKMTVDPVPEHRMTHMFVVPPPPEMEAFAKRFSVEILWQGFGMTEVYPLPMPRKQERGVPNDTIGHPVRWMEYGVVDDEDELVPPGQQGEIVFRPRLPHSMVRGYYKDPERTVEAFRNFMFHTGDLGYYDEEGRLHYRGRKQERIRRRGENISAPELEWVALRHPQVVECAAYGVPSELGEEEVKLDVVLVEALAVEALHSWLVANLPRYMVPRYLEVRDSFPKTPSERVEKYRLKSQSLDRPEVFDAERKRAIPSPEERKGRR
jgi:crotonobetaine/carnitine-CoA ligase